MTPTPTPRTFPPSDIRSISVPLASHTAVAIAQLVLFSFAMYGWILNIAPILGPVALLIAGFLAWASIRVHSTWFLLFLLAISWCTQGTPGRSQAWFESIQLAAWAGCLFAWRTHYHSLHQSVVRRILRSPSAGSAKETSLATFMLQLTLRGGGTLLLAIALAVLSAVLLGQNPMLEGRRGWSRWVQGLEGTLWPTPEILVTCLAIAILLREWEWRRLRPEEASIAIRAQAMRWLYPDMKRIVVLSRRARSKREAETTTLHSNPSSTEV